MVSANTKSVIELAKRLYAEQLRAVLEPQHLNRFVAIEPESGEYFLGDITGSMLCWTLVGEKTPEKPTFPVEKCPLFYARGNTFDEAVKSARAKYPSRLSHTIRIGHRAAFHLGGMQG